MNKSIRYIKSPLNYTGGKYKLLPQILPFFPKNINTFIDLFGGGFNVGINVSANNIIYCDKEKAVVEIMKYLSTHSLEECLCEIDNYITKYNLSKENKDGYLALRNHYNEYINERTPMMLYTIICYSFNNQIRFNSKSKYNMPFGKNRSSFNPTLRKKFIDFHNTVHAKKCRFYNLSFESFPFDSLTEKCFVYCDPPYLNSISTYNENNGWKEDDEKKLLNILNRLNENGVMFALSNNLKYNNSLLNNWKNEYNVHYLNGDYSNCNYHKKDREKGVEILITNY